MSSKHPSRFFSLAAAVLLPACMYGGGGTSGESEVVDRDDGHGHAAGECKIEGSDLGVVGASVYCEGATYTFAEWYQKDGEPGEYIGFRLEEDAQEFTVKAGGERYVGSGSEWLHPNGTGGPEVSAVSHVDFCDEDGHGDDGDTDGDGDVDFDDCVEGEECEGSDDGSGDGSGDDTTGGDTDGDGDVDLDDCPEGDCSGEDDDDIQID